MQYIPCHNSDIAHSLCFSWLFTISWICLLEGLCYAEGVTLCEMWLLPQKFEQHGGVHGSEYEHVPIRNIFLALRTQLKSHLLTEFKQQPTRSSESSVRTLWPFWAIPLKCIFLLSSFVHFPIDHSKRDFPLKIMCAVSDSGRLRLREGLNINTDRK
jgi:hypothetical protein